MRVPPASIRRERGPVRLRTSAPAPALERLHALRDRGIRATKPVTPQILQFSRCRKDLAGMRQLDPWSQVHRHRAPIKVRGSHLQP
jgi:hypothetical protein